MADQGNAAARDSVVSFEDEPLILVDDSDTELGHLDKAAVHDGQGLLHRAFSVFLVNAAGDVLLQQRASGKRLWPDYWSNSCCSHPRRGEDMATAVSRRLQEELGLSAELSFLYKFQYHASFGVAGSERELCWVYVGRTRQDPRENPTEISAWRWVAPGALDAELASHPQRFTPWFKLEWARIREQGLLPAPTT